MLEAGLLILDGIMKPNGFSRARIDAGHCGGGDFAITEYRRWSRRLELHFRYSLGWSCIMAGLRCYREDYMWSVIGKRRAGHYPGFSQDPLDAFM
jgi:hypothetical protein